MNWKEVSKTDDLSLVQKAAAELNVNERDERGENTANAFFDQSNACSGDRNID
ncbi:hypothetical protein NST63_01145 [Heyndrickxia sp. FSL W8-0496]|uniref:hypothetical protein n=1 Tax=Heyndrickxia TaxID=2837504 RepID=UPI0030FC5860